jgi:hypothetical protein
LAVATGGDPTATGIDRARREIRGDLDAILLKALAGEVELRYVSVAALQADLTRWLNGLPVEARVPSLRYRLGKFIRRNRLAMSASLAIVLALGAGAIGTLWQSARAREEAARALAEAQRADAVRDFLVELFRANDPDSTGGKTPDLLSILAKGAGASGTVVDDWFNLRESWPLRGSRTPARSRDRVVEGRPIDCGPRAIQASACACGIAHFAGKNAESNRRGQSTCR